MEDVKNNQYRIIPAKENPADLLFYTHQHHPNLIVPDQSHILEYFKDTRERVQQVTFLTDQVLALTGQIKETTDWMTKVYPEGTDLMNINSGQRIHLNRFITNIETRAYGNSMHPYAAHCHCIHCQGTHESGDHHLFISVPIVSNTGYTGLLPPQEPTQTRANNNTSQHYKNTRFVLPPQQSAFTASQQQQRPWPLPPKPTLLTPSQHSTPLTTSSASTRKSPTSSTINRTSGFMLPHPYCLVPIWHSNTKGRRSLSSSTRNDHGSGPSKVSSTRSMPTTKSLSSSTRTDPSHKTKIGETSHGVPYRNGNKYPRKNSRSPRSGSSTPHNNHSNHYNPRADETDYNDYDTPEIGDIYSEEVYNNID
jgi:hypothetical protein